MSKTTHPSVVGAAALVVVAFVAATSACSRPVTAPDQESPAVPGLWQTYEELLKTAKYIDLTHTIAPGS